MGACPEAERRGLVARSAQGCPCRPCTHKAACQRRQYKVFPGQSSLRCCALLQAVSLQGLDDLLKYQCLAALEPSELKM